MQNVWDTNYTLFIKDHGILSAWKGRVVWDWAVLHSDYFLGYGVALYRGFLGFLPCRCHGGLIISDDISSGCSGDTAIWDSRQQHWNVLTRWTNPAPFLRSFEPGSYVWDVCLSLLETIVYVSHKLSRCRLWLGLSELGAGNRIFSTPQIHVLFFVFIFKLWWNVSDMKLNEL